MKFLLFTAIATLIFTLASCNRGPEPNATTKMEAEAKKKMRTDSLDTRVRRVTEDYGERVINKIESRVALTDEQKVVVNKMSEEYDFANANVSERRDLVKTLVARIKNEVLSEEQLKVAVGKN